ncbi:MAG: hypothetical protein GX557_09830, partial [Chloroflexi bacterium]|nr:hypothetical protein [Chloroflexota bacterium]
MEIERKALMGMGIESVEAADSGWRISVPGALVSVGARLEVRQRIGADRLLFSADLPPHL